MTNIPRTYVLSPEWDNPESEIRFGSSVSMKPIYDELRKFESQVFEEEKPEHPEKLEIGMKTKNPLYNPKKWIKTRNPAYNPNKWIKACAWGACIKTKNPAYNPTKWIKTKNPAYSPNKYTSITTYLATVQGYKVKAWIDGKIQLTPYDGNKFNVKVPIKTEGWVSFITQYTPPIVRNPFNGKLIAEFDIEIGMDKSWCINISPKSNFYWDRKLRLDFTYGLKLLEVDVTKLANPLIEDLLSDFEDDIANSINCQDLKLQVEKEWQTQTYKLDTSKYMVVAPSEIMLSQIVADKEQIGIYGGIKTKLSITDDISNIPNAGPLPELKITTPAPPKLELAVPVSISYDVLDKELLSTLSQIEIGDENSNLKGKLHVKDISTFPSGRNIGLKVKFRTEFNKKILNVKATAYFTGQLSHTKVVNEPESDIQIFAKNNHYINYTLDSLAFNEFGNGKDKVLLSLAYKSIKESIESIDDIDISKEVNSLENLLFQALQSLIDQYPPHPNDDVMITIEEPTVDINNWAYSKNALRFLIRANATTVIKD